MYMAFACSHRIDPAESGNFAFLTYYFDQPSVNLDQCGQVQDVAYSSSGLSVTFKSAAAYRIARDTWARDDGMVLITYTEGCGAYDHEDRCYFKVTGLTYSDAARTVLARGTPGHPADLVSKGESEWGWWTPEEEDADAVSAAQSGAAFSWDPSAATPTPTPTPESTPRTRSGCVARPDTEHGLPTACFGKLFDTELDDRIGRGALDQAQRAFLEAAAEPDSDGLDRRGCGWFCKAFNKVKKGVKKAFEKVKDVVENVIDHVKDVVEDVKDKVEQAVTFDQAFDHDLAYKLPDPNDPLTSLLIGKHLVETASPWGPAVLLTSLSAPAGVAGVAGDVDADARLDVYCVRCGVSGTARVAGRATWTPLGGVTEARVELRNDMRVLLQLGVDARAAVRHSFETELFGVGLPGLSFGVVTVGPYVSVGAKVGLEAAAAGRVLAGAEVNLQDARVVLDLVRREETRADGWRPAIKPVFEVEGDVVLAASLGLPVGIKCGLKIASFDLSAGIVDEPSIKAVAQARGSVGLKEGGFEEVDGCTGISSQLSWRNHLYAAVTGLKPMSIHDTGDMPLARGCVA
jgi:hypothetical protein